MSVSDVELIYWPSLRNWNPATKRLWGQFIFYALIVGLVCNSLAAYTFGPIPIEWLSRVIFIVGMLLMMISGTLPSVPEFSYLMLLFYWGIITTMGGLLDHSIVYRIPFLTTPYPIFIGLRFFNLLAPLGCAYMIVAAAERYSFDKILRFTVWLGTLGAAYGIYAYFAQLHGWPEFTRTRMGTGGGQQATTFTYDFHRALGTFREPSHLAEWLLAPLFISFATRNKILNAHTVIMLLAMLLTGSLAGIAGVVAGVIAATVLGNPLRLSSWRVIGGFLGGLLLGVIGFTLFASGKDINVFTLFDVVGGRAADVAFGGGLKQSDRGSILAAAMLQPIKFFGYGFGRANFVLTDIYSRTAQEQTQYVVDYHSLYLHYLFATGVIGLILLLLFIITPLYLFWSRRLASIRRSFSYLAGGVVAYAVTNTLLFDELTPQFAMMVALVVTLGRAKARMLQKPPLENPPVSESAEAAV